MACYTLHPGDVVCAERGDRLATLLGSCIAIVLTDRPRTIAVMCHIVYSGAAPQRGAPDAACAEVAITDMYGLLRLRGFFPGQCEAYLFGGGNMFPALAGQSDVGAHNASWAFERLTADGVRVRSHDVGGAKYRRIRWTIGHDDPTVESVAI